MLPSAASVPETNLYEAAASCQRPCDYLNRMVGTVVIFFLLKSTRTESSWRSGWMAAQTYPCGTWLDGWWHRRDPPTLCIISEVSSHFILELGDRTSSVFESLVKVHEPVSCWRGGDFRNTLSYSTSVTSIHSVTAFGYELNSFFLIVLEWGLSVFGWIVSLFFEGSRLRQNQSQMSTNFCLPIRCTYQTFLSLPV